MWNLHLIPGEFENPYDGDMNDLDMQGLQDDLNAKLLATCSVPPGSVPVLNVSPEEATLLLVVPKRSRSSLHVRRRRTVKSKEIFQRYTSSESAHSFVAAAPHLDPVRRVSGASVVTPETCVKTDGTDSAPTSVPILQNERVEFPSAVQADLDQFTRSSDPSDLSPLPTTQTAQTLSPPPKLDFTTEGSTVCPCAPASPVAEGHNL